MTEITALALPDESQFKHDLEAINRFQKIVHANMVPNQDYGIIPGTSKPTLLKPGAEKIAKLLGLADTYEILSSSEEWEKPFFRYLIRCNLAHISIGALVSQGLGECNSMESKYRWRWVFASEIAEAEKPNLVTKRVNTKKGWTTMYRIENEDIYSQVNTILKMAKKRALVDAALSAGRLSNVFTQDMEDLPRETIQEETPPLESKETAVPVKGEVPTEIKAETKAEAKPEFKDFNPENVGQMLWHAKGKGKSRIEVLAFLGEKEAENISVAQVAKVWPQVKEWLEKK